MSRYILLSIHPQYMDAILQGHKRFEYRKTMPLDVKFIVFYVTSPVSRVVAVANVENIICERPQILWRKTRNASGISFSSFKKYFERTSRAIAAHLGTVRELKNPMRLGSKFLPKFPPQSYCNLTYCNGENIRVQRASFAKHEADMVFVGGVHGSGKSTLAAQFIAPYGYAAITASELIKKWGGILNSNKIVSDVKSNQERLMNGLISVREKHLRVVLDGHFCLLDSRGKITKIPLDVYKSISPNVIIYTTASKEAVEQRLMNRETPLKMSCGLEKYMKVEESYAREVSNVLGVPFFLIDTTHSRRVISSRVKKALRV